MATINKLLVKYLPLVLLFTYCSSGPDMDFDHLAWQKDKSGCDLIRKEMYPELMKEREKLLELNSKKLMKILGKPDRNELYKRNQKFFIYNISPAASCQVYNNEDDPLFLIVRFNALGLSSEIYLSNKRSPTLL